MKSWNEDLRCTADLRLDCSPRHDRSALFSGSEARIHAVICGRISSLGRSARNPKVQNDLPVYIFSGSDDPVDQRLEGVRVLVDRYRSAGLTSIAHDFYSGGRHEILHEINRRDVIPNLLAWISGTVETAKQSRPVIGFR